MITDLNAFALLASAKTRAIKNYLSRRLDRVTKIEVTGFVAFLGVYLFNQLNLSLHLLLQNGNQSEAWRSLVQFDKLLFVLFVIGGFAYERRQLRNPQVSMLLALPMSINSLVISNLLNLLAPLLLLFPFMVTGTILFSAKLSIPWFGAVLILLSHVFSVVAFTLLGAGGTLVLSERARCPRRLVRRLFFLILLSISTAGLLWQWHIESIGLFGFLSLLSAALTGLSYLFIRSSISVRHKYDPEGLWLSRASQGGRKGHILLLKSYLTPVPKSLAPIVWKDTLFVIRSYRSFAILFCIFAVAIVVLVLFTQNSRDAAQWLLSLCITASYLLANASFKFNDEGIELRQVIRAYPITARRFWWAKFWVGFLPIFWLIIAGHLLFLVRHFEAWMRILPGLALALFVAFTLIYVQNNFALYSYPYSRYAPLWYNLYVIVAALFFTILLFPPLAVAFLLFGYYAIFRVQRRIDSVEVLV